jgi:hypothetical protein
MNPPRWFRYALPLVLRRSSRECFIGDLVEELDEMTRKGDDLPNTSLWYGRQLISVVSQGRLTFLLAAIACTAILVTNLLFPLVGIRIPEFPAINFVCYGGAAVVWVFAGLLAYQRSGIVTEGLRAGATIALATMTTAMLTFAFIHRSVAPLAPFALLTFALVGATCGVLGSALARFLTAGAGPSSSGERRL